MSPEDIFDSAALIAGTILETSEELNIDPLLMLHLLMEEFNND